MPLVLPAHWGQRNFICFNRITRRGTKVPEQFPTVPARPAPAPFTARDWAALMATLVLAAIIRFAFFNGVFGSDDLVYLNRSVQISEGIWSNANYNGALRYGFNIPAGFLMYLFGINIVATNLWPLLCSLAEIAAVYVLARCLWDRQTALYSALVLTFMPLHVAAATRIHADPVVACFLTLSFVFFYFAEQTRARVLYFLTGIAMGLVFWTKEIAVVTLFAFVFYPLLWRKVESRWAYVIGGGLVMLLAHLALMSVISGDPFHAFKVVMRQVNKGFIQGGDVAEDGPWYYFRYLFVDIKHVWLAGILAAASVLLVLFRGTRQISPGTAYATFWLLTLFGILSFMPVSLHPLKFVMKQSNYLTLFLAPMALLAGYLLAKTPKGIALAILSTTLAGGFVLAGLEQRAYNVFTSNSKAAVAFAKDNPGIPIVGSINNGNIAAAYSILNRDQVLASRFLYMGDIPHHVVNGDDGSPVSPVFAVLDKETMGWGKNAVTLEQAPRCWEAVEHLVPAGFGLGSSLMGAMLGFIELFPDGISRRLKSPLDRVSQPRAAIIYKVNISDFWCEKNGG